MSKYDVTIIGSGPGGYVAAIRCAQLGMKVALVEKYESLGGTCLNVGCIPSKALLDSSEHYHNASHTFDQHGIKLSNLGVDLKQMIKRKDDVVSQTVDGIRYLMKKNKIDVHIGHGTFKNNTTLTIKDAKGKKKEIESAKFIIATGSKPSQLKGVKIDKKRVITSTEILDLKTLPKHLIVIGGGVIGLELGSVFARLGSKVSVVEYMPSIIGTMDTSMGKELQKVLKKLGFTFYTQHAVTGVTAKGSKVTVNADDKSGKKQKFEGDYCLVSVGRTPYTENLGLENIGVKLDDRGRIEVDENLQTTAKNVYAIGDVIKGAMLAHKAEEEGIFVAEKMAGQKPHINYLAIPNVVYTWPEVAGVGYTEQQLKEKAVKYKTGSFPFKASGRARASMDLDGIVKVYADAKTDEILGMHIIGPRAADLIAEGVVALEYKASAEDISRMSHAHPTFSEAIKEACLAATDNRAIHI